MMQRAYRLAAVALPALALLSGCASNKNMTHFGKPPQLGPSMRTLTVTEVTEDIDRYDGNTIKVGGYVDAMCVHSGCWMKLADKPDAPADAPRVIVKFTYDHELGRVPPAAMGKQAVAEGKLEIIRRSQVERIKLAREHGASPAEIGKIKGPKTLYVLNSPTAWVADVTTATPKPCAHEHEDGEVCTE